MDDLRYLIYRWETDLDHELAKVRIIVEELKLFGGGKLGELQVVPLVGDLKILQGIIFLPQGSAGSSHAKG